ncbi:hypothetical protein HYW43_02310 [Candidatus Daviesbacteria bacterium]|nr:hypothetical protein [Candidatus Daviesbacteria bacterium]
MFVPLRIRVEQDVIVRIHRNLKGKGVLNVSKNQEVTPSDVLGTAQLSPGFRILNLAKLLQVMPSQVEKFLKRSLGQRIYKGELLAQKSGWLFGSKIVVISPSDGILDFLNPKTGELRLNFIPKKIDLPAGVYGIVEEVDTQKGSVIIRTQSTLIHGLFGSGKLRDGNLRIVSKRDEFMSNPAVLPKYADQIIVAGSLVSKEIITDAISAEVSGIICGGIGAKDYKGMAGGRLIFPKKLENDIGISITICEGFGSIPIGEDIYQVLLQHEGRFTAIDGNAGIINLPSFQSSSIIKVRGTKLPSPSGVLTAYGGDESTGMAELKIGSKVRVVGNSFLGEQGRILAVDNTETILPSGIKALMVTIETNRRKIQVPQTNIEVVEYPKSI